MIFLLFPSHLVCCHVTLILNFSHGGEKENSIAVFETNFSINHYPKKMMNKKREERDWCYGGNMCNMKC